MEVGARPPKAKGAEMGDERGEGEDETNKQRADEVCGTTSCQSARHASGGGSGGPRGPVVWGWVRDMWMRILRRGVWGWMSPGVHDSKSELELELASRNGVFKDVPLEDCWRETGRAPTSTKRVNVTKGSG